MPISNDLEDVPEEVLRLAVEVFKTLEKADAWLHSDNVAFGNRRPIDLCDSADETISITDRLYGYQFGDVL